MKIGLLNGLHANLPALEAFFKDVESKKLDALYYLGDLIGYNIWLNEVVNQIKISSQGHRRSPLPNELAERLRKAF